MEKVIITAAAFGLLREVFATNVYAYIDVSATTYIIQIIAGVAVAVGAAAGILISRLKKKAKEKLNIDFDKKEKEEDIEIYDDSDNQ